MVKFLIQLNYDLNIFSRKEKTLVSVISTKNTNISAEKY